MTWRPTASMTVLQARARLLATIRHFFAERAVMEVDTPCLARSTVTDHQLSSLVVCDETQAQQGYLQTSPEYLMKRLLAAGSGCIYQLGKSFRGQEQGRYHRLEFTLLEWYRIGFEMWQLVDEVIQLLQHCIPRTLQVHQVSYVQVLEQHFALSPLTAEVSAWRRLVAQHVPQSPENLALDDCLDLLLSHVVVPQWPDHRITVVYDYPASQAALACLSSEDARLARRFEVYVGSIELANGYQELTDALEQKRRMDAQNQLRQAHGREPLALDKHLLEALQHGMPDCSGVALGVDRLLMCCLELDDIADVISFAAECQ